MSNISVCAQTGPTFTFLMNHLTIREIIPMVIATPLAISIVVLFFIQVTKLQTKEMEASHRRTIVIILSLWPTYAATNLVSIYAPLTSATTDLLCTLHFAGILLKFFDLVEYYFGGHDRMLTILEGVHFNLKTGLCKCCRCLSNPLITKRTLRRVRLGVIQYVWSSVTLVYVAAVLEKEQYRELGVIVTLQVIRVIPTLFAIYACKVFLEISSMFLNMYRLPLKFLVIQLTLTVGNIQSLILWILALTNSLTCYEGWPTVIRARWIHSCFLMVELFIINILAYFCYRDEHKIEPLKVVTTASVIYSVNAGEESFTCQT